MLYNRWTIEGEAGKGSWSCLLTNILISVFCELHIIDRIRFCFLLEFQKCELEETQQSSLKVVMQTKL